MSAGRRLAASALLWGIVTAPVAAQTLGQGETTDIPWLRLTAALLLCLGLAAGAAFAIHRRLGGGSVGGTPASLRAMLERLIPETGERPPARLTAIETRRLSPQVSVSVFTCDGRDYLVASTAQGQLAVVRLDEDGVGDQ